MNSLTIEFGALADAPSVQVRRQWPASRAHALPALLDQVRPWDELAAAVTRLLLRGVLTDSEAHRGAEPDHAANHSAGYGGRRMRCPTPRRLIMPDTAPAPGDNPPPMAALRHAREVCIRFDATGTNYAALQRCGVRLFGADWEPVYHAAQEALAPRCPDAANPAVRELVSVLVLRALQRLRGRGWRPPAR